MPQRAGRILPEEVDEGLQRRRHLAAAGVVEKDLPGRPDPIFQQGHQPSGLDLRRRIALRGIDHALAVHRDADRQLGIVDRQAARHRHFHLLAPLLELPGHDHAAGETEADAVVGSRSRGRTGAGWRAR